MKIILATTSKYKKKVFSFLELPFDAEPSNVDEESFKEKNPRERVVGLAKMKAEAVAQRHGSAIIIGSYTLGYFKGNILEKPKDRKQAFSRLKNLSGKRYRVYTGVYAINTTNDKRAVRVVKTDVKMRVLSSEEIKKYVMSDPNLFEYAHGYDPEQGISAAFIKKVSGSLQNLINGMPIEEMPGLLKELGY
jgi:septum formation protein